METKVITKSNDVKVNKNSKVVIARARNNWPIIID